MNAPENLLDIALALVIVALLAAVLVWRRNASLARNQLHALQSRAPVQDAGLQILNEMSQKPAASALPTLGSRTRDSRLFEQLDHLVRCSGSYRSPEFFIAISLISSVVLILLVWLASGILLAALVVGILAVLAPLFWLQREKTKRIVKFEDQLPDALDLMASALRAGHGLPLAFQLVAEEMAAPIGEEFQIVNEQVKYGASFQGALSEMPDRVDSADLSFLIIGLLIQRETGGNLSELFRNLAGIGRERLLLKGKVRVLSAEGRFSGVLLGVLPCALGVILTLINPNYMRPLWTTDAGHELIMIGVGMMLVGYVWMARITKIRV